MDQSEAPVVDALRRLRQQRFTPFTPPGHKQGRGAAASTREALGSDVFGSDVLAVSGLDDRTSSHRVLERAQRLMAEAVDAEHAFFSTCGSSLSVKSAMLSVAGPHEELIVGRDAHKSVVSGLILSGIRPIWVEPQWDAERHLAHPPAAESVAAAFRDHPRARGALITSPTPYGTCADLRAHAVVCHRYGRPLIVDEAWGAHLPFHDRLPTWAMDAGADICVTSVHKMGAGLEQGSVFHLRGDLIDPAVLSSRADLLGTTSPSVLIYAGLDGWRRQMVQDGTRLLGAALELAHRVRAQLSDVDGVRVAGDEFLGPGRAADVDPLQIVLDISDLEVLGYRAADWIYANQHVSLHLADHRRISAQLTFADDESTADRLLWAVRDFVAHADELRGGHHVEVPDPADLRLPQAMLPRDAFFARTEQLPAGQAVGRVSAEMITPYPPGIPAVLPGERINEPVLRYLRTGVDAGMLCPDAVDPTVRSVRVAVPDG